MILREMLKYTPPDEYCYIGCKASDAFVYIGTAKDCLEKLDGVSERMRQDYIGKLEKYKRSVETALATVAAGGKRKNVEKFQKTRDNTAEKIENWEHFLDRVVVEYYEHETDVPGMTFLIEGTDHGKYWFLHEVTRDASCNV